VADQVGEPAVEGEARDDAVAGKRDGSPSITVRASEHTPRGDAGETDQDDVRVSQYAKARRSRSKVRSADSPGARATSLAKARSSRRGR
jgi:hypothetical protein